MTITYPLTPPTTGFARARLTARVAAAQHVSPFSFATQTYAWDGDRWEAELGLPPLSRADAESWASFLLALRGPVGTFLLGDPQANAVRGTWAGTPRVNGANQTGTLLALDGLSNGATIKAGDWFQLGSGSTSRLYRVLQDVTVDGTGVALLDIFPRLRESPADNAAPVTSAPKGLFRLAAPEIGFDLEPLLMGLTFAAVEAL